MNTIELIDGIRLNRKGILACDNNNRWVKCHLKQGEIDGACAVYCLMMDLLILGYISEDDMGIYNKADRRTNMGKFIGHFLEDQGLIRSGYSYTSLVKELKDLCDDLIVQRKSPRSNDNKIDLICDCIEQDLPIMISVDYENGGAHALLAVGIEIDADDNPTKILCLDPGNESPVYAEWNCFIDIAKDNGKGYPFWCVTQESCQKVALGDMIIIEREEE